MKRVGLLLALLGMLGLVFVAWPRATSDAPSPTTRVETAAASPTSPRTSATSPDPQPSSPAALDGRADPSLTEPPQPSVDARASSAPQADPADPHAPAPPDSTSRPRPTSPPSSTAARPIPHAPDPAPGEDPDEARVGNLKDRTGRGGTVVQQLNEELMPLISECIEMAQERDPTLEGLLSIDVQLIPQDDGKALVESVALQENNEVTDAELIECIEQSTLSVDGIETTENFALSLPVSPTSAER